MTEQPETTEAKHTPGPWHWTASDLGPQLESKYPGRNPVLIAAGCGNDKQTASGVEGCMPEKLGDPFRACPLHPTADDRALIAAAPDLLAALERCSIQLALGVLKMRGLIDSEPKDLWERECSEEVDPMVQAVIAKAKGDQA